MDPGMPCLPDNNQGFKELIVEEDHIGFPRRLRDVLADKKTQYLSGVVMLALEDASVRQGLVAGLQAKDEAYRYNCYKVLLELTGQDPALLYPLWDTLVSMLASANCYQRMVGVTLIAQVVAADSEHRFEDVREAYFAHLDDESVIVARYVAQNAARVGRARPEWVSHIVERLLDIVRSYHNANRRDLLAADVIASCAELFELAPDRRRIVTFVQDQLHSKSPKTRQAAKELLAKSGAGSYT
jgi:hypothetical protein